MMAAFPAPRGLFGASRNIMLGDQPMMPQFPQMGGPAGMGALRPQMTQPQQPDLTGERLFALGGLLQGNQNAVGQYHAMQQARATAAQEAQKDALARQAERAEWVWREDYKRANPSPANNDTVNDYNFILQKQGQAAADQYLRGVGDPIVTVPLSNGQVYNGPRSGLGAALGGQAARSPAPTRPVGNLTPIAGGPTQPASGGF
jgi:hypothetical protein